MARIPEADPAIDPAYQTVPISELCPHRPARPPESEGGKTFKLVSEYTPAGHERTAIPELVAGVNANEHARRTWASPARARPSPWPRSSRRPSRPALILAPNKTLAAQLYSEFKSFFPENAVEYFVSYYDYDQPEAYIPRSRHLYLKTTPRRMRISTASAIRRRGRFWSATM